MASRLLNACRRIMLGLGLPAILILVLLQATPAFGQLTAEDIAVMREEGQAKGWTFTVGETPATKIPLEQLCGCRTPDDWQPEVKPLPIAKGLSFPPVFDWCAMGGCTPVKHQGCGDCWAHATCAALECAIKIVDGVEVDLSEQWLVSCNSDWWNCTGSSGNYAHNYHWWKTDECGHTGAVLEADFPYAAADLPCDCPVPHYYFLESWQYFAGIAEIPSPEEIKAAIMTYGPITVEVSVNAAFGAYTGGVFNDCSTLHINHAVVLVGWDDTQGTEGVWILRNSWGTDWGMDGYMFIEYGCAKVGTLAAYIVYTGPQVPELAFTYPNGIPDTIPPIYPTSVEVDLISVYNGVPVPGSGQLHYTINDGPEQTEPMFEISPAHYEGTLPTVSCADRLEFYFSAEEEISGTFYDPDPGSPRTVVVSSEEVVLFADDFFADQGWTVWGDAAAGHWERGLPMGHGSRGDPMQDFDGSYRCYLTGNAYGDSDVDGGTTYLESPAFDLAGSDAYIHYARWYCNDFGSNPYSDVFVVSVSNDDGASWIPVETVGPEEEASGGWYQTHFRPSDFVPLTDQVKVQFAAADLGDSSIIEAAVDAFSIVVYNCYDCDCTAHGDLDLDGAINPVDVVKIVNYVYKGLDARQSPPHCPGQGGDWNCDEQVNPVDVVYYVNYVYKGGADGPCDPCE